MDQKKFERLQKTMQQGLEHAQGKKTKARVTIVKINEPKPISAAQIKKIRSKVSMSQAAFADLLNVSDKTVKAWEQDINSPSGIALRMLQMIKNNPDNFLEQSEKMGIIKYG